MIMRKAKLDVSESRVGSRDRFVRSTRVPRFKRKAASTAATGAPSESLAHAKCKWCPTVFAPRTTGGKPQRFCSKKCRHEYQAGLDAFAEQMISDGRASIKDLKSARKAKLAKQPSATRKARPRVKRRKSRPNE
jgi:hypothetical protein